MTKRRLLLNLLGILPIVLLWQGCKKDQYAIDSPKNSQTEALSLNIRIKASDLRASLAPTLPMLRAQTEEGQDLYNENKIDQVSVLFYKEGLLFWQVNSNSGNDIFFAHDQYIIPVPIDKKSAFDGTNTFNIYVISNLSFNAPQEESNLSTQKLTESVSGISPQRFVMIGKVANKPIDMATAAGKSLGSIDLKRVASKIRINQPIVQVDGYEVVGEVTAKLRNYKNAGLLLPLQATSTGSIANKTTDYRALTETINGKQSAHFYSYYTSWNDGDTDKPEITLSVPMKKEGEPDNTARHYYYTIPIETSTHSLQPNTLYNTTISIDILGSLTQETPQRVIANISILPWSLFDDTFALPAVEYLTVSEHKIIMKSIEEYSFYYLSSHSPIKVNIKKVYSKYVDENGEEKTTPYNAGSSEYPFVRFDNEKITINSSIPKNNLPKEIELEITNGISGLKETVFISQYPSRYIVYTMGTKSNLNTNGHLGGTLNNKAMYHIVVLIPPSNMILGYPPRDYNDQTLNNEETSQMVSPSFELASQLGATPTMYYSSAVNNCSNYTETRIVNSREVTLDDWRLPTEAEIKLVDELQHDSNSAVKSIMTGKYYWDAYSTNNAYKMKTGVGYATSYQAHVRCVRDVKEDTE